VEQTDYDWMGERDGYSTLWTTLFDSCYTGTAKIWHADVVRIIAPAIRSLTIVDQSVDWQLRRIHKHCDLRGTKLEERQRCFRMLYNETQRQVVKLWAFTICEKAVVMEIQISMFALIRALKKGSDYQLYFILFISVFGLITALFEAWSKATTMLHAHEELMDRMKFMEQASEHESEADDAAQAAVFTTTIQKFKAWLMDLPEPGDLPIENGVLLEARRAKEIILWMRVGTLVLFLIIVHGFFKLVMAPYCTYGFWNFPLDVESLGHLGCVDLSRIAPVMEARRHGR
jgi:hypothetical protein